MSRGPGKTQRAILDALDPKRPASTTELAEAVGADRRQVRAAVTSLESRGLIVCRRNRCVGYRKDHPTVRYDWEVVDIAAKPLRFRRDVPPRVIRVDMPVKGTLVWSLSGWKLDCDVQERAAAAGDFRLRANHRDRADPALAHLLKR